ncbi:MAG: hypothetical protein WD278_11700 [Pirellulales bacterium]
MIRIAGAPLLVSKRIAFTGRLASLRRAEAAALIAASGGRFVRRLDREASVLVVGHEGYPLAPDGRPTRRFRRAYRLARRGCPISIVSEPDFLNWLGVPPRAVPSPVATPAQLAAFLALPIGTLEAWVRWGLFSRVQRLQGVAYFRHADAVGAKIIYELLLRDVAPLRIASSIHRMKDWLADVETPLAQLAILHKELAAAAPSRQRRLAGSLSTSALDGSQAWPGVAPASHV